MHFKKKKQKNKQTNKQTKKKRANTKYAVLFGIQIRIYIIL